MVNVEVPPKLTKFVKFLRSNKFIRNKEGVMADKRVEYFKGSNASKLLSTKEGMKLFGRDSVESQDIQKVLQDMIDHGLFIRVVSVNNSRYLQPDTSRNWSDDAIYVWVYEGSQLGSIIIGITIIGALFALTLYPLWPHPLRVATWYVLMLLVAFVSFVAVVAVIRAIVFVITYFTLKPGVWLFPRLFDENAGVIDSFISLWEWHKPDSD